MSQIIRPATIKAFSAMLLTGILLATSYAAKADGLPNLVDVIEKNRNSVVNIATKGSSDSTITSGGNSLDLDSLPPQLREFFKGMPAPNAKPRAQPFRSLGSGFIISSDGYVVTNAHVIDDAESIRVTLKDRRELDAKVIGVDENSDIALLKVEAKDLPAATFGDSSKLKVGQWVVAIGAPFGLEHSASQGIVSAFGP